MRVPSAAVLLSLLAVAPSPARPTYPRIIANDNRTPAGVARGSVREIELDVVRGMFHPDRDDQPGADVLAFAEHGKAPSIPAPLIRVTAGTTVRTRLHNGSDSTIIVWGLSGARTNTDTVMIPAGGTRSVETRADVAGTYLYRAATNTTLDKPGNDRMLGGAFIVDEPGARKNDRVFVLLMWVDTIRLHDTWGASSEIPTINGKAWPNTERLSYDVGDTVVWRIVNPSLDTHPMHLHGTYFDVMSRGSLATDTIYSRDAMRAVVTERLVPLTTMKMRWVAPRPGTWLFHCHLTFHVMPHPPLGPMAAPVAAAAAGADANTSDHNSHDMQSGAAEDLMGMGGLVLATTVRGTLAADRSPRRRIRLNVEQYDSVPGEFGPPFSYELDGSRAMSIPAKPIIVTQNEPIAINVVNRTRTSTSVHWHGLEIESFYDGVAGIGGTPKHITPMIAPNDSFLVKMTPPRAGTFIFHSHMDDARQQSGGLYGAFIVVPPGKPYDADHERLIILSTPRDTGSLIINGESHPTIRMRAGTTYRIRLINITLDRPSIMIRVADGEKAVDWNVIARDGADLPAKQAGVRPADFNLSIGQTMDVIYTPGTAGELSLTVRGGNGVLLRSGKIVVLP